MENRRGWVSLAVWSFFLPSALMLALAVSPPPLSAQAPGQPAAPVFSLGGMLAATAQARFDPFEPFFSLRAIPKLDFSLPAGRGRTFDGEASANAYATLFVPDGEDADLAAHLKPYRAWLRFSSARFEARLGLQQLSFGSATLFRPLMWFDSLDPRDPLRLTDGVYGLLMRIYARGNANVWLWGLYGNSERRGFDFAPPDKKALEVGGRVEIPLFKGEIAATYHHRRADIGSLAPVMTPLDPSTPSLPALTAAGPSPLGLSGAPGRSLFDPLGSRPIASPAGLPIVVPAHAADKETDLRLVPLFPYAAPLPPTAVPENRIGLDGKWDLGIGVWFEGALVHQRTTLLPSSYQRAYTLGADYTFAVGRGLTLLAEHFRLDYSARAFSSGSGFSFTALLVRYPFGLLDELSGIFYYDWESRDFYRFVGWTRRTDAITFSAIAFWNPAEVVVFQGLAGSGPFAGVGLELILAYNF